MIYSPDDNLSTWRPETATPKNPRPIDIYNSSATNIECPECHLLMAFIEWERGVCFECVP